MNGMPLISRQIFPVINIKAALVQRFTSLSVDGFQGEMAFPPTVSRTTVRNANGSVTSLLSSRSDGPAGLKVWKCPLSFVSGLTIMCSRLFEGGAHQSCNCWGEIHVSVLVLLHDPCDILLLFNEIDVSANQCRTNKTSSVSWKCTWYHSCILLLYPISIPFSFHLSILCIIDLVQITDCQCSE